MSDGGVELEHLWPDAHRRDAALIRLAWRVDKDPVVSPVELRVLEAMSRGLGQKGTADVLALSVGSVKFHLKHASRKLQAKNTTHACCEALRQGLIP